MRESRVHARAAHHLLNRPCLGHHFSFLASQREGIALAKAAGKYKGRKASLSKGQVKDLRERLTNGESVTALALEYGVRRQTVYNYRIA